MKKKFKIIMLFIIIIFLIIVNNIWWLNIIGAITGIESTLIRWIIAGFIDLVVMIIIIAIALKKFNKGEDE